MATDYQPGETKMYQIQVHDLGWVNLLLPQRKDAAVRAFNGLKLANPDRVYRLVEVVTVLTVIEPVEVV